MIPRTGVPPYPFISSYLTPRGDGSAGWLRIPVFYMRQDKARSIGLVT